MERSLIEISIVGIGGMSSPELGHLTLYGRGLGPDIRASERVQ